jgi:hypothetical protein
MSEADLHRLFPTLRIDGYRKTSDEDSRYNCVAWANGDDSVYWDPRKGIGMYWPRNLPRNYSVTTYVALFKDKGYEETAGPELELGYEKVAIFMSAERRFTHVSKQLPNGEWQSKIGHFEDIEHQALSSLQPTYGSIYGYMKRTLPAG